MMMMIAEVFLDLTVQHVAFSESNRAMLDWYVKSVGGSLGFEFPARDLDIDFADVDLTEGGSDRETT